MYNGSSVADVLVQYERASADVLTVAVCLVANLAVDEVSQVQLHNFVLNHVTWLLLMNQIIVSCRSALILQSNSHFCLTCRC